ncbi:MAG: hypothetical protein C0399_05895 [Syntrophus sp. (in: bacteria)]|nr:hypothetical protein [Syntrophus sp. (in: bacteria)]
MICQTAEKKRTTDLDALTEDQWADIDRLLMIVWKTKPTNCSVKSGFFEERHCTDEPEESFCYDFQQACGL